MKLNKLTGIVLSTALFAFSCGNNQTTEEHSEAETHHHHEGESTALKMNNGEKWVLNEEMKPYILNGEKILNDYIANKDSDYSKLATQLEEQNSNLISSCTMDGESHDELHKWLLPHLELVKELSEAQDSEAANVIIDELKKSIETLHQYFQ